MFHKEYKLFDPINKLKLPGKYEIIDSPNFLLGKELTEKYRKKTDKFLNLVVSKSGNTLETIINSNILINKKDQNIFITENKKNYLFKLA